MGTFFSNLDFWFQGKAKKVVPAQTLWFDILKPQIETGTPYMLYKVLLAPPIQIDVPASGL
jgi:ribonucleotide reductase alpha subunit